MIFEYQRQLSRVAIVTSDNYRWCQNTQKAPIYDPANLNFLYYATFDTANITGYTVHINGAVPNKRLQIPSILFVFALAAIDVYRHDVTKVIDFYNGDLWGNFSFFVGSNRNFVSEYLKDVDTHHESFS